MHKLHRRKRAMKTMGREKERQKGENNDAIFHRNTNLDKKRIGCIFFFFLWLLVAPSTNGVINYISLQRRFIKDSIDMITPHSYNSPQHTRETQKQRQRPKPPSTLSTLLSPKLTLTPHPFSTFRLSAHHSTQRYHTSNFCSTTFHYLLSAFYCAHASRSRTRSTTESLTPQ
jgi:hypothetical protein